MKFLPGKKSWVLGVVAGLALCGIQAAASDLEDIRERGVLRVALPLEDAPPFVVTGADGRVGGFEGQLLTDLARRMDIRLEVVRLSGGRDEVIAEVLAGRADLALGQLADSLERAKSVRFSTPYLTLNQMQIFDRLAATRAGGIAALLARDDTRLAAWADSPALPFLREEWDAARLVVLPTMLEALSEAEAGRVAGLAGDDVEIGRWMNKHPEAAVQWRVQLRRDRPITLAMAMHWKAEDLQAWVNLYLEKCRHDETLDKLRALHFGEAPVRADR